MKLWVDNFVIRISQNIKLHLVVLIGDEILEEHMCKDNKSDKAFSQRTSIVVSVLALIVSVYAAISANDASMEANYISSQQLKIAENSYKPEFVYNGPRDTSIIESELSNLQPENYYDFGFEPSFSKISGFASDLSCEAYSHYELEIGKLAKGGSAHQETIIEKETWSATLDVYGEFFNSIIDNDKTALTVYLNEARAKVSPDILGDALQEWGYEIIGCRSYCVGSLIYTDISDNVIKKPFSIDMEMKRYANFENAHTNCAAITERIVYDWSAPNRGISETIYDDIARNIVFEIEQTYSDGLQ